MAIKSLGFPQVVGFFQQRRVFGATLAEPDTLFFSRIGDYSEFRQLHIIIRDDDPIIVSLPTNIINIVRHIVPANDLIVLTDVAQWIITTASAGLSALTINPQSLSSIGSSYIRPVTFDDAVVYVRDGQREVIGLEYSRERGGYAPSILSQFASHLFSENIVVDLIPIHVPNKQLVCLRIDGQLGVLTYNTGSNVKAWTRWDTQGRIEPGGASIRVRTGVGRPYDSAYMIVQRKVNNQVVRYIERTTDRDFTVVEDCFFLDSGVTIQNNSNAVSAYAVSGDGDVVLTLYDNHGIVNEDEVYLSKFVWAGLPDNGGGFISPDYLNERKYSVTVAGNDLTLNGVDGSGFSEYQSGGQVQKTFDRIDGLWHLNGETVIGLADGNVLDDLVVHNGSIQLSVAYGKVHVGLSYMSEIETLSIEAPNVATLQGLEKSYGDILIRLRKSRGLLIKGTEQENFEELVQRSDEPYDFPIQLQTGDASIYIKPEWTKHGRIQIRQPYPLPMEILAILPILDVEDPR